MSIIKKGLYFGNDLFSIISRIIGQVFALFVEIYIVFFMPVKRPDKFVVLHTIFAKTHLVTVIKLGMAGY